MVYYWPEKYQLGILTHYLRAKDISYIAETHLYSAQIDVLGFQRGSTIAIELKSKDFKRGLKQAERNSLLVNYSFLAMWGTNITENLVKQIDSTPIGLLAIGNDVKCLSPPGKCETSNHAKQKVVDQVSEDVRNQPTLSIS